MIQLFHEYLFDKLGVGSQFIISSLKWRNINWSIAMDSKIFAFFIIGQNKHGRIFRRDQCHWMAVKSHNTRLEIFPLWPSFIIWISLWWPRWMPSNLMPYMFHGDLYLYLIVYTPFLNSLLKAKSFHSFYILTDYLLLYSSVESKRNSLIRLLCTTPTPFKIII